MDGKECKSRSDGEEEESCPPILNVEVSKILKNLNANRVSGPDRIENKMLKLFIEQLTNSLTAIFNSIIEKEEIHSRQLPKPRAGRFQEGQVYNY